MEGKLMSSLDVRIFMVTIFLSVVLLAVSVTELLCCFRIIQDVASLAEWKFLLYYLLSEQFPSIAIACFFKTESGKMPLSDVEEMCAQRSTSRDSNKEQLAKGGYRRNNNGVIAEYSYAGGDTIY
mmetsp:Transcript_15611/g.19643  ORF Transcript_15611/g.19643 Transcript_15611/m.19643 type:complete len:125 (-) Transcript_15611:594-968(-)